MRVVRERFAACAGCALCLRTFLLPRPFSPSLCDVVPSLPLSFHIPVPSLGLVPPVSVIHRRIAASDVAPALEAMRLELEKAKREDALNRLLVKRPARERLVQMHVMMATDIAPALQASQAHVEKAQLEDQLSHKLAHRPTREELIEKHLLLRRCPSRTCPLPPSALPCPDAVGSARALDGTLQPTRSRHSCRRTNGPSPRPWWSSSSPGNWPTVLA